MIEPLLGAALRDEAEYHHLGSNILDLIGVLSNPPQESRTALLHIYEHGPCSNCREKAVANLAALAGVPPSIVEEWKYDCVPEITAYARA